MSEMDDNEILAEALAMAEMIAKDLEKIYIPETELKCLLETKQLPENHWMLRSQLNDAIVKIRKIMLEVDEQKKALNFCEHGDVFYERHMVSLYEAMKELQQRLQDGVRIFRDQTRKPLRDDRPEWVKKT